MANRAMERGQLDLHADEGPGGLSWPFQFGSVIIYFCHAGWEV